MKHNETKIWVYADWEFLEEAQLMGVLTSQRLRGKEIFSFEYTETWMNQQNPIFTFGVLQGETISARRKKQLWDIS